ncbi:MAG: HAMP domain-containing sensor histidine kinase [Chloroflexota bacterium]
MKPSNSNYYKEYWNQLSDAEKRAWKRRGRRLFLRFLIRFGLIVFFIFFLIGTLGAIARHMIWHTGPVGTLIVVAAIFAFIIMPIATILMGRRTYQRVAMPLTELIEASRRVANGDLSVRVGEHEGDFAPLSRSFNHMVNELALSDERRRNLTADIAHELRTPLHIIQGNLEGVLDGVYEPDQEHIEATLDETHLLGRLIEDLRILSLAESGHLRLSPEEIRLEELLTDIETSFSGTAAEANIELIVESPEEAIVEADYGRLTQVVNNLVSNAMRHTPSGGRITLSAQPNGSQVKIDVKDTGEGIPEENLPFVFDRFWRGDKARTHGSSTGLGLAISQQLIKAMNGSIEVASQLNQGTTFSIFLPKAGYQELVSM